jgi:hypothetical protein
MNSQELVVSGSARSQEIALRPGARPSSDRSGFSERIASVRPRIVIMLTVVGAAIALGFAGLGLLDSGEIPWLWSALGGGCAFVAVIGFMSSKCVRCGANHYVVSDLFTSEAIPFNDVCMVVEAPGFFLGFSSHPFAPFVALRLAISYIQMGRPIRVATAAGKDCARAGGRSWTTGNSRKNWG